MADKCPKTLENKGISGIFCLSEKQQNTNLLRVIYAGIHELPYMTMISERNLL